MGDLSIRRYDPGDEQAVWELHERALRDVGAFDPQYTHLDRDLRAVQSEYFDAGGDFLVGTIDDEVVAMGAFQPGGTGDGPAHSRADETHAVMRRFRVDPDHQRRGFGTEVLRAVEGRASDAGFECTLLDTTTRQAGAIEFYRSHGYEEVDREERHGTEILYFEKPL